MLQNVILILLRFFYINNFDIKNHFANKPSLVKNNNYNVET